MSSSIWWVIYLGFPSSFHDSFPSWSWMWSFVAFCGPASLHYVPIFPVRPPWHQTLKIKTSTKLQLLGINITSLSHQPRNRHLVGSGETKDGETRASGYIFNEEEAACVWWCYREVLVIAESESHTAGSRVVEVWRWEDNQRATWTGSSVLASSLWRTGMMKQLSVILKTLTGSYFSFITRVSFYRGGTEKWELYIGTHIGGEFSFIHWRFLISLFMH